MTRLGWVRGALAVMLLVMRGAGARAQEVAAAPLPDVPTLMRAVEANQRSEETVAKRYLYHSVETLRQSNGHGGVKRVESAEYDVFWVGDVEVRRQTRKDGRDLTPDEQKKEGERLDKSVEKARERRAKVAAKGGETDPRDDEVVTVSRLLELGRFTNPRRVMVDGRPTIAVDFAGDPAAKTRNRLEEVIRDMEGTAWIDEQDKVLRKSEGRFVRAFRVGGGLLADIKQGTSFGFDQKKVNDEVWLPERAQATGAMRVMLLFHFDGDASVVDSGYRKFRATSTILPDVGKVEEAPGVEGKVPGGAPAGSAAPH